MLDLPVGVPVRKPLPGPVENAFGVAEGIDPSGTPLRLPGEESEADLQECDAVANDPCRQRVENVSVKKAQPAAHILNFGDQVLRGEALPTRALEQEILEVADVEEVRRHSENQGRRAALRCAHRTGVTERAVHEDARHADTRRLETPTGMSFSLPVFGSFS